MREKRIKNKRANPAQRVTLGFFVIAILGAVILCSPIGNVEGKWQSFTGAFFDSMSAVTTTGLMVNKVSDYSALGQVLLVVLMQVGALGFMTLATLFFLILKKRISVKDRLTLQGEAGDEHSDAKAAFWRVIIMSFAIEAIGAILMMPAFISRHGVAGVWLAFAEAVSAFSGGGMIFSSIEYGEFVSNVILCLPLCLTMIAGSLGFSVISELLHFKKRHKMTFNTKVILLTNAVLWISSFVFFFLNEYSNAMGGMSFFEKMLASLFQSVNPRGGGYDYFDQTTLSQASRAWTMLLAFVGGSPSSTCGGIKVTTFALLFISLAAGLRNENEIVVGKHTINKKLLFRAVTNVIFMLCLVLISFLSILCIEGSSFTSESILFEAISAVSNLGLGMNITHNLSAASHYILAAAMFFGRLGTITIALTFVKSQRVGISYPEASINIS